MTIIIVKSTPKITFYQFIVEKLYMLIVHYMVVKRFHLTHEK